VKVLVAGASGALGIPTVRALRAAGHDVFGTTRSAERTQGLAEAGATPVIADAMDEESIQAAVRSVKPEAVVDLLTALPKDGPRRPTDMEPTNQTRIRASGNLFRAALDARVSRYVAESFYLVYGSGNLGDTPLAEDVHVPISVVHPQLRNVISAMVVKESRALDAAKEGAIHATVLRFGGFYGFGAGLESFVEQLRKRRLPVVDSANATPWVHIEDCALAVVAAVESGAWASVYNIVDDEARPMSSVFRTMAKLAGAPSPPSVPGFVVGLLAPYLKALLIDSTIRPSNIRARREIGWAPRYRTVEDGLAALLAQQAAVVKR
jgi:nucleoside-diphosphate-sugar epimerase